MPRVYLASPLGFSPENRPYLEKVRLRLFRIGYETFDPWAQDYFRAAILKASKRENYSERVAAFNRIAKDIGHANEQGIRDSDLLLGVLDGTEVDSGTASEIGFAAALGLRCYGLRTDQRDSGEYVGIPVNLQVLYSIEKSGGKVFRRIKDIEFS